MEEPGRQFLCGRCRDTVWICRRCDRGQFYCGSGCAQWARRLAQRQAGARYQRSRRGRFWTASTMMAGKTTFILAGWTGMNVVVQRVMDAAPSAGCRCPWMIDAGGSPCRCRAGLSAGGGGLFAPIALDLVQLEDGRVMDQAVDGSHGHARVRAIKGAGVMF